LSRRLLTLLEPQSTAMQGTADPTGGIGASVSLAPLGNTSGQANPAPGGEKNSKHGTGSGGRRVYGREQGGGWIMGFFTLWGETLPWRTRLKTFVPSRQPGTLVRRTAATAPWRPPCAAWRLGPRPARRGGGRSDGVSWGRHRPRGGRAGRGRELGEDVGGGDEVCGVVLGLVQEPPPHHPLGPRERVPRHPRVAVPQLVGGDGGFEFLWANFPLRAN